MKIPQYINELIQKNGSITIHDFGAFILKETSSRIDEKHNLMLPPSVILNFDENIKTNDNILIDYVSKTENISTENAADAVKKFTEQLNALLNSGKTVEFRNIGKLHLNPKKQIVFNYDPKAEYVSDAFGLNSVKAKPVTKQKEVKQVIIKEKTPKVKKPRKKFPKAAIWLIIILLPISIAVALAFIYPDNSKEIYNNSKNYITGLFKKSEPVKDNKLIVKTQDTLKTNITDTVSTRPLENRPDSNKVNKPVNIEKPVTDGSKKFHIIVGCFQSRTNAENYLKTIEAKGYKARFFEAGSDGLYKISCSSFATREEAQQELGNVIRNIGVQAWIIKK
jgi:nucleoid DNA-binding protein